MLRNIRLALILVVLPIGAAAHAETVTFDYQLDAVQPMNGIAVLTGLAAVGRSRRRD